MPGVDQLPPYGNNLAFHQGVAKIFPMSYATNYILSHCYAYTKRPANGGGTVAADNTQRGRNLAEISEPSNTWIMTEYGSNPNTGLGGYYTTPGYLNASGDIPDRQRWRGGRRHTQGRHWLFVDNHVKWHKDPPFESSPGVAASEPSIAAYYEAKQVYTGPQ